MELWQWMGALHPKLVQFPLVLLLVGLLFDLAGVLGRRPFAVAATDGAARGAGGWGGAQPEWVGRAHWAGLACTAMGTVGLLLAFICGIYAEIWAGRAGIPQHPIELHELMANLASWGFVILLVWRIFLADGPTHKAAAGRWLPGYVAVGMSWYLLLAVTGWLGGKLVFEYGAAVMGAAGGIGGGGVLSMEDLNTLATRQTDENLRYSEWMHHIFGWMTLGLAASLLAQAVWPGKDGGKRLKWIVPAFLLAGGVFLFFMADRDLYALTDLRQWRDREVQLHKTLAVVMGSIGIVGLWRKTQKSKLKTQNVGEAAANGDPEEAGESRRSNSKLVAVLALIGGSMLFTHVHTVAPYANVAAGVYIAHVVLGLVALAIGLTRLLQDWVTGARLRRALAVGFGALMLVESVLLITYNEGLPRYIGYGEYNRWGPHGGTVAPYGGFRAELVIDQSTGAADVYVLDRFKDEPRGTFVFPGERPSLLLSRGYQDTALPLVPVDGEAGGGLVTHLRGRAEFLKRAAALDARLSLRGATAKSAERLGYFDPWVTPVIRPVPENELARYVCPMHEGVRSKESGACPLCGMELQAIKPPRPAGELHDATYDLRVTGGAEGGGARLEASFVLEPVKDGKRLEKLAIVHEQPMHLIVVSRDLAFFDHVHPVEMAGSDAGKFAWKYRFPRAGDYLLFADYTPPGERAQVFRVTLRVSEKEVALGQNLEERMAPLVVDPAGTKLVRSVPAGKTPQDSAPLDLVPPPSGEPDAMVELVTQPRTLLAGLHADLVMKLSDARGTPLTDLAPYLGAMGHCVVISEDTHEFLHSHPRQVFTPARGERGGPTVTFHTLFPKPGRYRIWAQFKRPAAGEGGEAGPAGERLVIAEFTVEVQSPWVPAGVLRALLGE